MNQLDIFSVIHERFKIDTNHVTLFEAFAGYGAFHMAMKRLGWKVELIGISEIDKYAIKVYASIHTNYLKKLEKFYLIKKNNEKYNRIEDLLHVPDFINFFKSDFALKLANKCAKNYGAIGSFDRLPKGIDICTYSFPCQDISLAGKQRGMVDGTRSNYGYIFLDTVANTPYDERPKVLIMENVKALFSEKFRDDWREIQHRLEKMGYMNFAEVLNAKDYGVAQNRERVFIVSILGEYNYNFPKPFKLEKRLKDYLEDEVSKKYYLSPKNLDVMLGYDKAFNRKKIFLDTINNQEISKTLTTKLDRPESQYVKIPLYIPEATQKGYAEAHDGDGVYINRPHQKRGVVQKGMIQTIKTQCDDIGVVESKSTIDISKLVLYKKYDENIILYDFNGIGVIRINNEYYMVRKLTPREALRLMDVEENDIDIILSLVSETQAYKLAGNSIVVNVLVEMFKEME